MKTSVLSVLALSIGLLVLGSTSYAAEPQPLKAVPKMNATLNVPTDISLPDDKKLYKPVPMLKRPKGAWGTQAPIRANAQIQTFDPILSALENYKRALILQKDALTAYNEARNNLCWNGGFNQADQAAAGCLATDTIAVCYGRCFLACMVPFDDRFLQSRYDSDVALTTLKKTIWPEYNPF